MQSRHPSAYSVPGLRPYACPHDCISTKRLKRLESELTAPKRPAADMGAAHAEETLPGSLIQLVSWVQRDGHEEVTLLTTARGRTKCRLGPKHEERNANLDCSFTDQSKARDALADAASLAAEELPSGEERKGGLG